MAANFCLSDFGSVDLFRFIHTTLRFSACPPPPSSQKPELVRLPSLTLVVQDDNDGSKDLDGGLEEYTLVSNQKPDLDIDPESNSDSIPPSYSLSSSS